MKKLFFASLLVLAALPMVASAHEVYVLSGSEIAQAMQAPHLDIIGIISSHAAKFAVSGLVGAGLVGLVLWFSLSKFAAQTFDPMLLRLKRFAPALAQATLGLALLASGVYGDAFGPELSLAAAFGHLASIVQILLVIAGVCLVSGILPRLGALIGLLVYLSLFIPDGSYILNYATYFGESAAILFWGAGYSLFVIKGVGEFFHQSILAPAHKYKFVWLRLTFALSLFYAAIYAKYLHADLAMQTVLKYRLHEYFHLDPSFLVLGALLTECTIALFYFSGFEVRFTSLFFLSFLTASLLFFGEAVWPHIILIGTALSMFVHGYDRYTLMAQFSKRGDLEPVL